MYDDFSPLSCDYEEANLINCDEDFSSLIKVNQRKFIFNHKGQYVLKSRINCFMSFPEEHEHVEKKKKSE